MPPPERPATGEALLAAASAAAHRPGLVVLAGPPGSGRSTLLHRIAATVPGPVHLGGGLAMLAGVPAVALSRAVRARLPAHDIPLLAEAVRSRVRTGLLILDDLQYADPATLAALPLLARHCRVVAAVRTPHRLPEPVIRALRATATLWQVVPPLDAAAATALAHHVAPHLDAAAVTRVVRAAGGVPLAVAALARQAADGRGSPGVDVDQVTYAIAAALADLPRPARTALAALGLLGRPAPADLLGPGAAELVHSGLARTDADSALEPVSGYVADIAAGLLDPNARADLHRRLADLVTDREAARHLAAAGDHHAAYRRALHAADHAPRGDRADLLLFACQLPDVDVDPRVRVAAADAALSAGRPHAAVRVLSTERPLGVEADALRGEALLQAGDPAAARAAVQRVPDAAAATVVAVRDRVLLLADLATNPDGALDTADKLAARYPQPPAAIAAALAAVRATHRVPDWDRALADAAADPSDPLAARWSAWLLTEHLAGDGRLTESATVARAAAQACAADLAYSWQTRFLAAADWATALHGCARPGAAAAAGVDPGPEYGADELPADAVHRHAADLTDRALPSAAHAYATAAAALIEADTGLLGAARTRLDAAGTTHPAVAWVSRETAWLDGQPDRATAPPAHGGGAPLLTGLHHITARWAAHDTGTATPTAIPPDLPAAARRTLTAWATGTGFTAAADAWRHTAVREQVRCLLAAALHDTDADRAVPALTAAESIATHAGLTVLAGRARRALRRHHVRRDSRSSRSHTGTGLTRREHDVLRLVAAGEPSRRIAGQLGISTETVDTHIRAAMRRLGARTRTEAAALAFPPTPEDGR